MGVHLANLALSLAPDAYWRMGDVTASGQVAHDISGNGLHASSFGGISRTAGAVAYDPDAATAYNGTDSYLLTANTSGWSGALSIACWIYSARDPTYHPNVICHRTTNVDTDFFFCINNQIIFGWHANTGWLETSFGSVVKNTWTHVGATRSADGTTAKYYLDGSLVGTKTYAANTPSSVSYPIAIGFPPGDGAWWSGYMDEMMLWRREITGQNYADLYAASNQKFIDLNRQRRMRNWRAA